MFTELLHRRLEVLRQQEGLVLRALKIGKRIEKRTISQILRGLSFDLAPELLGFYREMNGLELSWSVYQSIGEIYGSIVILPLQKGLFGYRKKIDRSAYKDAFEDVLWNRESYSIKSITELKHHRVFETIEGQPAFVTFKPVSNQVQLYHVYEEEILPILVKFDDYVQLLFQYLGAGDIREHLTNKQWKRKINMDAKLQAITKWGN